MTSSRRISLNHFAVFFALLAIPAYEVHLWSTTGCIAGGFRDQLGSYFCGAKGIWIVGVSLWAFALFPGFYIFWNKDYDRFSKNEKRAMQAMLIVGSYFLAAFIWLLIG